MIYTPTIYIDGKENIYATDFKISFPGTNQLNSATITINDPTVDGNALFGKHVEIYTNCGNDDNCPTFRGVVKGINSSDTKTTLKCLDVRTYITGKDGKNVNLNDQLNYDGFSITQYLKSYIEDNINTKDKTYIGTDMLSDTKNCDNMTGVRGDVSVLGAAVSQLETAIDDAPVEPLRYIFDVVEGPLYSNIIIKKQKKLTEKPALSLSIYDGILSYNYKRRPAPSSILVTNSKLNISTTIDLAGANHGPFSAKLSGAFTDTDSARKAGIAELKKLQQEVDEISLNISRGYDIGLESLVDINVGNDEINGIHRVVSKNISGNNGKVNVSLQLNRRPIMVSEYLMPNQ